MCFTAAPLQLESSNSRLAPEIVISITGMTHNLNDWPPDELVAQLRAAQSLIAAKLPKKVRTKLGPVLPRNRCVQWLAVMSGYGDRQTYSKPPTNDRFRVSPQPVDATQA